MLKKLVPAVLGALLIASPVIGVTTAAAAPQTTPAKMAHHKTVKHKATHHAMKKHTMKHTTKHVAKAKHHMAKKKAKKPA